VNVFAARVAVVGHRGLGRGSVNGLAENSPESMAAAVAVGLPWVEVDVRRTADDALVAGHDPMTPRGREVAACTLAEAVSDGMWRIGDLLEVVPDDVGIVLDVKTALRDALRPAAATTAALLAPLARRERRRRPVVVYGFDPSALLILRELAPEVPRGMLTWVDFPFRKAVPAAVHLGAQIVAAHTGSFLGNRVERRFTPGQASDAVAVAHQAGLEVVAWCPTAAAAVRLVAAGVDALCLNDVPSAIRQLSAADVPLRLTPRSHSSLLS
jgi:glycerophosphoryl diester phosphodiesterase